MMQNAVSKYGSHTFLEMELPSQLEQGYGIRLYYNRLAPHHREVRKHSHLAIELDMFSENCHGTYVIGAKSYQISPGDIFILRSNEQHSIVDMDGGAGCVCTGVQFSPDFVWSPSSELGNLPAVYDITVGDRTDFNHKLAAGDALSERVRREIVDIVDEFNEHRKNYEVMVKMKLVSILIFIARERSTLYGSDCGVSVQREKRRMVENAMNYIDNHYHEAISFEDVATNSDMSASYLAQLFKKLNGFSVWDYIISKRISYAKKKLLTSNDLILEISLQSGFNSLTNFNRAFKRLNGISPREYRLRNQKESSSN